MGKVFIVWGGNRPLAEAVRRRLANCAPPIMADVGGNDADNFRSHFLGQRVIEQMNESERAIILAQWPPDNMPNTGDVLFRPNLMFEWGFLLARFLHVPCLHIFLIGVKREQMPSDVINVYTHALENIGDREELASEIVTRFVDDCHTDRPDPFGPFHDWATWEKDIARGVGGDDALAQRLIHGIQPAYYRGQLDRIAWHRVSLANRHEPSVALTRACVIARNVEQYYEMTDAGDKQTLGKWHDIISGLGGPLAQSELVDRLPWLEVVRLNFLGLSLRRMAEFIDTTFNSSNARERLLEGQTALRVAERLLESKVLPENCAVRNLWLGYVLRNLGRVCFDLDDAVTGREYLLRALDARTTAKNSISARGVPEFVLVQLLLEMFLVHLDLVHYKQDSDAAKHLQPVVEILRDRSPKNPLWHRTLNRALTVANDLGLTELFKELTDLHSA